MNLDKLTWAERCEYYLSKIPERALRDSERTKFTKWFMAREVVGCRFDVKLVFRCYRIWCELQKGLDHFIVISGREGMGKSTLAHQIGAFVNPNFTVTNCTTTAQGFLDVLRKRSREAKTSPEDTQTLIMDEGTELLSREALHASNRVLTKTFFVQRALRMLVIINIPNFHMLDSVVRMHRVRTLVQVIDRGKYKCIFGTGITTICKEGQRMKTVSQVKLRNGTFWHGWFAKEFPKTIDRLNYEEKKYDDIRTFLDAMQDDVAVRKMIPAHKVAKEIGMSGQTMRTMIQDGKVKGKQIGGKYYVTKEAYTQLLET